MPENMKRIIVSGYLGFSNFGDEAILHVLINDLLKVGYKRENITVISNNPEMTIAEHNIKTISRWNLFAFINALITHSELVFIGGLFQDKTSFRSLFYYAAQMIVAALFQREIAFFAVGVGPLQGKMSKFLFDFATKYVHFITVRDQVSSSLIPFDNRRNVAVTCDPVWTIKPEFGFKNRLSNVNWNLPILGLSMRNDKLLKGRHLTNIIDKLARVLTSMKEWQILLIPCMPSEDLPVLFEVQNLLIQKTALPERVINIEHFSEFPITQQAGILASCSVVVGMRFHSLLVSVANGKPVFGLIYDQKVKSLLDYSGQVGVSYRDDFEQPWSYFWQNIQHSSDLARMAAQKAEQFHKINIDLLQALYNVS